MCDELHECGVETTHSNTPVRREDRSGRLLHFYIWMGIIDIFCAKKLIYRALFEALQVDVTIEVRMESPPFWTIFVLLNTCIES